MIRRPEKVVQALIIGKCVYTNFDKYEGDWKDNKKDGDGEFSHI